VAAAVEDAGLLVRSGRRMLALPIAHVAETMRPLAVDALPGLPPFVRGLAVIRGVPTPVVDLAAFLGEPPAAAGRFVALRLGDRQVAVSVDEVIGMARLPRVDRQPLPPLLDGAAADAVEWLALLDGALVLVLRAARIVPDEVWMAVETEAARP
jgi:purine-binding chemotaxis protein CheW